MTLRSAAAAAAVLVACLLGPARAVDNGFTGQQYLDDKSAFSSGYSYALLVNATTVADFVPGTNQISPRQQKMRACFIGTNFDSVNLQEAVLRHLRAHPEKLLLPAFVAVFGTFQELCPD